jgi:glucokinase
VSERYLGMDLGGTNIKLVVVEVGGAFPRVLTTDSVSTAAAHGPSAVIERLIVEGRRTIAEHGPVHAAGVGVPGIVDWATGVVQLFPNLPGPWPGQPLRDPLAAGLAVPVTVVNDARAFTLAEAKVGAGRGSDTMIGMTLGTGIGGGVVLDGRLVTGTWGAAGEIGHQTVVPDGPRCGCGNKGCVEAVAQAGALARLAGRSTAEEAFVAARAGDARCHAAVRTVAGYLGIALANCVTVLGANRIVIGGGIAAAGELLLGPVRDAVREHVMLVPADEVSVVPAALGNSAGAIGAALAAE